MSKSLTDTTPAPSPRDDCGRMTITLHRNDSGRAIPTVEFDPVGSFTSGLLHAQLPFFIQQVEREQAKVRHEQATAVAAANAFIKRID